jgi:anti-sigma regulatory factor (Ser/Thr protein kinase)
MPEKPSIYTRKRRWKWLLFAAAVLIFAGSLLYINKIATNIAKEERNKIKLWADAINKKAALVNATDTFFNKIQAEERQKVELWAKANQHLITADFDEDVTFYVDILSSNTTIPVIETDANRRITKANNIDFSTDTVEYLKGALLKEYSAYPPIEVRYFGKVNYLYYKESKTYTKLREVLNKQISSFLSEIVTNAPSVPVIVTDSNRNNVIASGNVEPQEINDSVRLQETLGRMEMQNKYIVIDLPGQGKCYVFYEKSYLLTQLKYYPYVQFLIIFVFLLIAYLLFSTSRRVEQNQVWVGMARETAHQLGTPLSSLMAWIELLKLKGVDQETVTEVTKDVKRLETITERFSKIGSTPKLQDENIADVIYNSVAYLKLRTSRKVIYNLNFDETSCVIVPLNRYLFEWVIENLCKNAIDAMSGSGCIDIDLSEDQRNVYIDISDTGKGIPKSQFKTIFNPGYSSKKVGWGLGLTLAERIIEQYHSGRIFVKSSTPGKGTMFRIQLKKSAEEAEKQD